MKDQLNSIEKSIKNTVKDKVTDIIDDHQQIEARKMNLVVFGLPEIEGADKNKWSTPEKIELDKKAINKIITEETGVDIDNTSGIIDAKRIGSPGEGRPRALRLTFKDLNVKRDVLKNAIKLRKSTNPVCKKLYINPDLTDKQREEDKVLRAEMWVERGKGRNVIIRKGKLVEADHEVRKTRNC